jgi:hypothetical protein
VPPDRQRHRGPVASVSEPAPAGGTVSEQLGSKLKMPAGQAVYKLRKAIVEPVCGQIQEGRGFRRFSFRGLVQVTAQWTVMCLTHNLLKLFRARTCPRGASQGGENSYAGAGLPLPDFPPACSVAALFPVPPCLGSNVFHFPDTLLDRLGHYQT